ncbi:hypothetical protein [Pseudotamlana carrageenivorans]|nr:hypothetical protein [Tamlana carrageenivorans]
MTQHYTIEIIDTDTHFKLTYRDNKFKKLEHLRGRFNSATLKQIGRIIPHTESNLKAFETLFKNKVLYTKVVAEKSLYAKFLSEWYSFFERFTGLPPKFTGMDGKSLKSIITYLTQIGGNETEALALWQVVLSKWNTLKEFHKQNTDLKYINSKLNIILHEIKQQNNTFATGTNGSVQL